MIVGYFSFALLNFETGVINKLIVALRLEPFAWYNTPEYWPAILTVTNLRKGVSYGSVIYLAAMLGIRPAYYEAAMLDGANRWQQIRYITLLFGCRL